jgi:RNA polymerase primary sigma factor
LPDPLQTGCFRCARVCGRSGGVRKCFHHPQRARPESGPQPVQQPVHVWPRDADPLNNPKPLMKRILQARNGDWNSLDAYLKDIAAQDASRPPLSHEDIAELGSRACKGDVDAQETLVRSHLRLVVKIAHQYAGFGLPLADLISEGNLGLLRAAELYDPKFGTKFLTYASVWIKQRIHRAITSQAKAVRIPVWRSQRLRKLSRIHDEISSQLGRTASEDELAERLGISHSDLADLQGDRVEVVSFDAPPAESEGPGLAEALPDDAAELPGAQLGARELHDELLACLAELDDRELQVLSHKFGLRVTEPVSLRELGRRLGLSHEWVRRIAELALVKARRALGESARWTMGERKKRLSQVTQRLRMLSPLPRPAAE